MVFTPNIIKIIKRRAKAFVKKRIRNGWKIVFTDDVVSLSYAKRSYCDYDSKEIVICIEQVFDGWHNNNSADNAWICGQFSCLYDAIVHTVWHEIGHAVHYKVLDRMGFVEHAKSRYRYEERMINSQVEYWTNIRMERVAEKFATRVTGIKPAYMREMESK